MSKGILFFQRDIYILFGKVEGILTFENNMLILEFTTSLFMLYKSEIKELRIPLDDLDSIEFVKNFPYIEGTLFIRSHRMKSFEGIPQSPPGQVALSISEKDSNKAQIIASEIDKRLREGNKLIVP